MNRTILVLYVLSNSGRYQRNFYGNNCARSGTVLWYLDYLQSSLSPGKLSVSSIHKPSNELRLHVSEGLLE